MATAKSREKQKNERVYYQKHLKNERVFQQNDKFHAGTKVMITKRLFDTYQGKAVHLYTLANEEMQVGVLDFGGILNFIRLKTDKGGKNILVGYDNVRSYIDSHSYCGATVGRVSNRIAGAKFTLDGREYKVSANENGNCLHGGAEGFDKRFYDAEEKDDTLVLSLTSADGDMGFPAELKFTVEFTLSGRELFIKYTGVSDGTTLFAPTCHAYFNLNDGGEAMDTFLQINAESYTPADERLIPLGTVEPVKGTPLDFTQPKRIGEDYAKLGGKTYDHNFCLSGNRAATVYSPLSDITLNVYTDMPGLQLYVGCSAVDGHGGGYGFCLEPQFYPNAVNVQGFETPILRANTPTEHYVKYRFGFHSMKN